MAFNKIIRVTSSSELSTALRNTTGGETILLANTGQDYTLSGYKITFPTSEVTITSEDASNPVNFTQIKINGSSNLHFDNITVGNESAAGSFSISSAQNITISNTSFYGGASGEWGVTQGAVQGQSGLSVRFCDNVTVENTTFTNHSFAVNIHESDNVTVVGTEIKQFQGDGIRLSGNKDILIEANYIHDPLGSRNDLNHDDLIQMWAVNETRASENITIRGNILDTGDGSQTQSIFMRNEDVDRGDQGVDRYYKNIVIEDNIIHNSHLHGITLGESDGVTISNNTLLYNTFDPTGSQPGIQVNANSTNVTVENNITSNMNLPAGSTVNNNLVVNYNQSGQENYIGNLFFDAVFGGHHSAEGLQIIPGSLADQMNVGSSLSTFNAFPDTVQAVYVADNANGKEDTFVFDAQFSADKNGFLNSSNATYHWDFGDGQTAQGIQVTHTFSEIGRQQVTLTVTTSAGEIDTYDSSVKIVDPLIFDAQLENVNAPVDASTYQTNVNIDLANYVSDATKGNVYHIESGHSFEITRGQAQIYNLDQMYISFDYKQSDIAKNDGQILGIYKSFALKTTQSGALAFNLYDNSGQLVKITTADNIIDNQWHNIKLGYDTISGKAQILLDDQLVGEADTVGITKPHQSWGLLFGDYSWGNSADGLIDNITIQIDPFANDQTDVGNGGDGGGDVIVPDIPNSGNEIDPQPDAQPGHETNDETEHEISPQPDHETPIYEKTVLEGNDGDNSFKYAVKYDEAFGHSGNDYIRGAKEIYGGDGDDKLFTKTHGDGVLYGDDGNDILVGYQGDDYLVGGAGADNMRGAEGNDTLIIDGFDVWIQGGSGYDTAIVEDAGNINLKNVFFHSIEKIDLANGEANELHLSWSNIMSSENDTLYIHADKNDVLTIDSGWAKVNHEQVTIDGAVYNHYSATQGQWLDVDLFVSVEAKVDVL